MLFVEKLNLWIVYVSKITANSARLKGTKLEALLPIGKQSTRDCIHSRVSPSTICRELKRNVPKRGIGAGQYRAEQAQRKTILRHRNKMLDYQVKRYIIERLTQERLSPELIAVLGRKEFSDFVSHETIYKWIWALSKASIGKTRTIMTYISIWLTGADGKERKSTGQQGVIPNRVSIEKRPKAVDKRRRIGDLEVDLMVGKAHKGALLVITDRSTLLTHLNKLPGKEAGKVKRQSADDSARWKSTSKRLLLITIRLFAKHEQIGKRLTAKTFFTSLYITRQGNRGE